jgi:hypothetical protein
MWMKSDPCPFYIHVSVILHIILLLSCSVWMKSDPSPFCLWMTSDPHPPARQAMDVKELVMSSNGLEGS